MADRRVGAHALQAFVEENHARVRLENELNTRKAELESGTLEREKGRGGEGERERGNARWGESVEAGGVGGGAAGTEARR